MNCKTANNLDIVTVITKFGFAPKYYRGTDAWCNSPLRNENVPSMKICTVKNVWYDHGEGIGGTVVDLVRAIKNCSTKEALENLRDNSFSFHQPKLEVSKVKNKCEITSIGRIADFKLIKYLHSRKIDISLARKYCEEIHYSNINATSHSVNNALQQNGIERKPYRAIGIKNDLGGYDTRNESYKRCINVKAITSIKNGSNTLNLFEGFIDFLSYLTLMPKKENEDFIITNSTSLVKNTIELLPEYDIVKTFFDNDISGKKAAKLVQENCSSSSSYLDESEKYKKHTDVNDYLKALKR